jgi:sugar/nucleoside kinase (ribokinase family)
MLAALGDLLEDVIVSQRESVNPASDTAAIIVRRRGGSASCVAVVAARRGSPTRFIGQVGDDDIGRSLVDEISNAGVDTGPVRFSGTTGTIVVLVDERGERTMFTDRRACLALADPDPAWLDGIDTLHVPFYSLAAPPISETAQTVIAWAHDRGIAVSIDVSSESVIRSYGPSRVVELLAHLAPDVVLANEVEGRVLSVTSSLVGAITVVKRGSRSALLHVPGSVAVEVPATPIGSVTDTTGAGDAFAAGFLTYTSATGHAATSGFGWREDPLAACRAGHDAAAALIASR